MRGFTLIEMSVVLLILSLITTAAYSASNMIEFAHTRTLISTLNNYRAAINSFDSKYRSLPGDFPKATLHWPESKNGNYNGNIEKEEHPWEHLLLSENIQQLPINTTIEINIYNDANTNNFVIRRPQGGGFMPSYLHGLDLKADDGRPDSGDLKSNCNSQGRYPDADNQECTIFWKL